MNKLGPLLITLRARFIGRSSPPSIPVSFECSKVDSIPYTLPFGILKLLAVTTSSIGLGAFLAKEAAQFLKSNKLYVPKEDD
ncbi:hypothetical protein LOAG_02760 [Loa loa]|uniref:Essential MCU regulator, mitochondrial n=1 Tax=Loa loa TaxID=7209 RepID=A0A1I7V7F3_LOALO|nr:hypothetical protein LOAG_02760 [Loa loa]EFO25733.1 hypothetical protein LOAG_02760 [Loa loa]